VRSRWYFPTAYELVTCARGCQSVDVVAGTAAARPPAEGQGTVEEAVLHPRLPRPVLPLERARRAGC